MASFVCSLTSCCNLSGASPDDGRFPVRPSSLTLTGRWRHVPVQARVTKLCGGEVKSWRLFLSRSQSGERGKHMGRSMTRTMQRRNASPRQGLLAETGSCGWRLVVKSRKPGIATPW